VLFEGQVMANTSEAPEILKCNTDLFDWFAVELGDELELESVTLDTMRMLCTCWKCAICVGCAAMNCKINYIFKTLFYISNKS
jgi:hypothetical protein